MINILIYVFVFLAGLAFGSLINVLIYRLPIEEDVVVKPSHCVNCQNKIKPYDLIPVISYIFLRGKCRHCGEKISIQYPLIELLTALIFTGIYYRFGWVISLQGFQAITVNDLVNTLSIFLLSVIFLTVFFIDLKHYIIPNQMIVFGIVSGLIFAALKGINAFFMGANLYNFAPYKFDPLKDAGLAMLVGFLVFFLIVIIGEWIMKAEAMGMGDVKLMAVVGLFLGLKLTVLSMFLSFIIGSVVSIFLLATKIKGRKDQIPFGPFIVLGSSIALIWGTQILSWYFNLGKF